MNDSHTQWTAIHTAAQRGDAVTLETLLVPGVDPAPKTKLHWTPLHFATRYGHTDCCRLLLNAGAPLDATTKVRGYMPIHLAALDGHTETVAFLIERGAKIDSLTIEGWTPLHAAVEHAHVNTVSFLLKSGADPNLAKRPSKAVFPLHTAAQNGRADLVQLLLDAGANPYVSDKQGNSPCDYAKKFQFVHLLDLLPGFCSSTKTVQNSERLRFLVLPENINELKQWIADGGDVNLANHFGQTLLHLAVLETNLSALEILLNHGARPNRKIPRLGNPLDCANFVMHSHPKETEAAVQILVKFGAKLSRPGSIIAEISQGGYLSPTMDQLLDQCRCELDNQTRRDAILRWAVACGDCIEAEKQLRAGADPNMPKRMCGTVFPLEQAIIYNDDIAMTKLLIRYGAKVDRRTVLGDSLLADVASTGKLEIVKILVEAGAKVNRKGMFGETALYSALESGHRDIADYLMEHGAKIDAKVKPFLDITPDATFAPIFAAAKSGDLKTIQRLAEAGADLFVIGEGGMTLLHAAAENGHTTVVAWLLNKNLDRDARDWQNHTPLHLAGKWGYTQTANLLIEAGADPTDVPSSVPEFSWYVLLGRLDLLSATAARRKKSDLSRDDCLKALQIAIEHDRYDMVQEMLNQGIHSSGALSYAAWHNKLAFVRLLIHHGANVNQRQSETLPPLHSSASVEIAQVLLDHGANIYMRSFNRLLAIETVPTESVKSFLRKVMACQDGSLP